MKKANDKPDTNRALRVLKDFQLRTVEYAFRRLYTDKDCTPRFLVADEVGLGKTLVARGLIAKMVDALWDRGGRIDVIYICSNADIARQNIARLYLAEDYDFTPPDRLTLLPLHLHEMAHGRRMNFVALTPGTSFDLRSRSGTAKERALLHRALRDKWEFRGRSSCNVFSGYMNPANFYPWCTWMDSQRIDAQVLDAFTKRVDAFDESEREAGRPTLQQQFEVLCQIYSRSNSRGTRDTSVMREHFVGELRQLMARACLEWLEPDLIIMDEFQRFKHLMDPKNPAGELARDLFDYTDDVTHASARVVLLSATPYKMYTLHREEEGENHYSDFLDTLSFLLKDASKTARIEELLDAYAKGLHRLQSEGTGPLLQIKTDLEVILRRVMVRTERMARSTDRNGMLKQITPSLPSPEVSDIRHYLAHARISRQLDGGSVMDYWKSAPYLLSFMEDYRLKNLFKQRTGAETDPIVRKALLDAPGTLISHRDLKRYRTIDPRNARLRGLLHDTVALGTWKLLWIPPALPYYGLFNEYSQPGTATFTKRLIFSCWHVVPKMIAAMVSYEAERQCALLHDNSAKNTPAERKKRTPLLRFNVSDGRLTGMPVLGLIYPAAVLSVATDPLGLSRGCTAGGSSAPDFGGVFAAARSRVADLVASITVKPKPSGPVDEDWYWAAPLIFDLTRLPEETRLWFDQETLAADWAGEERDDDGDRENRWHDHVAKARKFVRDFSSGELALGRPPDDLIDVLTWIGIAGPATCSWRSLGRLGCAADPALARNLAGQMAHAFLKLFNLPESMSMIRGSRGGDGAREPYWVQVLYYSAGGCLQAVLDEYIHILRESLGRVDAAADKTLKDIAEAVEKALKLRTSRVGYDHVFVKPRHHLRVMPQSMRVRFAMRFGKLDAEDGGEPTREDHVRAAFNSPFWPFVLATTSIGQEGLDFHQYCHAVVHWNLPSNPVDLEQREGRVHRYKGHAVRKNVAKRYGLLTGNEPDVWSALFRQARKDCSAGANEIEPFWVFPIEGGAYIERHVPILPTSSEELQLIDLKRSVSLYRLAFGQLRQEDLVEFLKGLLLNEADIVRVSGQLLMDLEPPG